MLGPVKHDHVRVALTAVLLDRWRVGVDHHSIDLRAAQQRVQHVVKERPAVPEGPIVLARHSLGLVTHRHQGDQPVPAAGRVGRAARQRGFTRFASGAGGAVSRPILGCRGPLVLESGPARRGLQGGIVDRVRGIPAGVTGAPGPGRVVEPLPELCGDRRRAVEAAIGAGQLVVAEPQYRPELPSQSAVAEGGAHVGDDVPGKERGEIATGEVRMGVDHAHRHRLAPVAVPDLLPRLVVHVDDLRFSHIRDPAAVCLRRLRPSEVLEPRQGLVVWHRLPSRSTYRAVGVVAEMGCLRTHRLGRKPLARRSDAPRTCSLSLPFWRP